MSVHRFILFKIFFRANIVITEEILKKKKYTTRGFYKWKENRFSLYLTMDKL
jgi:hypothetical protein